MRNQDTNNNDKLKADYEQAIKDGDSDKASLLILQMFEQIGENMAQEAASYQGITDKEVLARRGVRQLTSEEHTYYQSFIAAAKEKNPQQAIANINVALPKTIIESVFEDLVRMHPLLQAIDFQSSGPISDWIINTHGDQMATWGLLCDPVTKQIENGLDVISLVQNKLSAYMFLCNSMLELGAEWLDKYVRTLLQEAIYLGLEDGIINGKGGATKQPIGMRKDLKGNISPENGYPDKAKTVVTSFDTIAYGELLATISTIKKGETEISRDIESVILIVNPHDYFTKIMPATTPRATDGTYTQNVFPFPTVIIRSSRVAKNEAIFGIGSRYLFAGGIEKDGRIDYSDEFKFTDDMRAYRIKTYGNGQAKDNNAFLLLDISGLQPTVQKVNVTQTPTAAPKP